MPGWERLGISGRRGSYGRPREGRRGREAFGHFKMAKSVGDGIQGAVYFVLTLHKRLGHVLLDYIRALLRNNTVHGLQVIDDGSSYPCDSCEDGAPRGYFPSRLRLRYYPYYTTASVVQLSNKVARESKEPPSPSHPVPVLTSSHCCDRRPLAAAPAPWPTHPVVRENLRKFIGIFFSVALMPGLKPNLMLMGNLERASSSDLPFLATTTSAAKTFANESDS
ncbi:hypothetical protein BC826DRAFT_1080206 [Russula brevipes]|nr:hypothetical protein BC826DRAFT_1080206 [Russula brevipes]